MAFLNHLHEKAAWQKVGLHWRNRFLLLGEVYAETSTGRIFRVLGTGNGGSLVWPLIPHYQTNSDEPDHETFRGRARTKDCWQHARDSPYWINILDWEDVEAVPCIAVSPLGVFARGLAPRMPVGVVLFQQHPARSVLRHAALTAFRGLTDADLKKLARELDLDVRGSAAQFA